MYKILIKILIILRRFFLVLVKLLMSFDETFDIIIWSLLNTSNYTLCYTLKFYTMTNEKSYHKSKHIGLFFQETKISNKRAA